MFYITVFLQLKYRNVVVRIVALLHMEIKDFQVSTVITYRGMSHYLSNVAEVIYGLFHLV